MEKMQVTVDTVRQGSIDEFAVAHGLHMEVNERKLEIGHPARFYAKFKHCDILGDGILIGTYGNGSTTAEAIKAYAKQISLKTLVINGNTNDERLLPVWRLVYDDILT